MGVNGVIYVNHTRLGHSKGSMNAITWGGGGGGSRVHLEHTCTQTHVHL